VTNSTKTSVYAHLYLGNAASDPSPVFRDLSPTRSPGGAWPPGAAFAVSLKNDDGSTFLEYFGQDGWPLDFPAEFKRFALVVKRELQVYPWPWRSFDDVAWRRAEMYPDTIPRARALAKVVRAIDLALPSAR
jgi:hypothetical protein